MTKRKRGQRIWVETPTGVQTPNLGEQKRNPRSAHHGLIVTCTDTQQGTYLIHNHQGSQWLVAQGVDGLFDLVEEPLDHSAGKLQRHRVFAAVKAYITRNGNRQG